MHLRCAAATLFFLLFLGSTLSASPVDEEQTTDQPVGPGVGVRSGVGVDPGVGVSGVGCSTPTPIRPRKPVIIGSPLTAVPSTGATELGQLIATHLGLPSLSSAQRLKLESAAKAYPMEEYRQAINWAKKDRWWKSMVKPEYVSVKYDKLMTDWKAATLKGPQKAGSCEVPENYAWTGSTI
jgi:hypothetical protein